jgi:glutamate racemase
MIGIFDSGYGGLTILHGIVDILPQYSYLYLGDNARAPYGSRSHEEILQFTTEGVEYLFQQGCPLVILACNTSSANALREIQQNVLPARYPDKRVLGILVPTIEQITGQSWGSVGGRATKTDLLTTVGIVATEQTVRSGAYEAEIKKRNSSINVIQQTCPELVPLIEQGAGKDVLTERVRAYLQELYSKVDSTAPPLTAVLLGCTHYALIADLIAQQLPTGVVLYEQPTIVAESLRKYLTDHPEIETQLDRAGKKTFLTTGKAEDVSRHSNRYFGQEIQFKGVSL